MSNIFVTHKLQRTVAQHDIQDNYIKLHKVQLLLRSLQSFSHWRSSLSFTELYGSLPCSQEHTTCPYLDPNEPSPRFTTLFPPRSIPTLSIRITVQTEISYMSGCKQECETNRCQMIQCSLKILRVSRVLSFRNRQMEIQLLCDSEPSRNTAHTFHLVPRLNSSPVG
jgi:hypothetical protein